MFTIAIGGHAAHITTGLLTPSDGLDGGKLGIISGRHSCGLISGECTIPDGDQV